MASKGDFAPDAEYLSSLAAEVESSLSAYKSANSSIDKANALRDLGQYSKRLTSASTDPQDLFSDFTFQPLGNASVRVGIAAGLFDHLSDDGTPLSISELSKRTHADESLLARILRTLASLEVVKEDNGLYCHTPLSRAYTDKSKRAWATWMWDVMIEASGSIGTYFDTYTLKNPTDGRNAPFTWAQDAKDVDIFELVQKMGKLQLFKDAMSGSSLLCAEEAVATYAFNELVPGDDNVLLVDVGGAQGQTLKEIRSAYPDLKGKMVLQDLQSVLDGGAIRGLDAELQPYDFFKEAQSVIGAAAYLYQRIFHDWSDENCKKILQSLKPAMRSHSKLLISDVVVPDHRPHSRKCLRDMNMLLVGGMERSEKQWSELLESQGFRIEKVHGLQNPNNSIVEARLA